MAKTFLFTRLRRVVTESLRGRLPNAAPPALLEASLGGLSRRGFIEATAALSILGCRDQAGPPGPLRNSRAERVAVIGAGLAGLSCAFRLFEAGVDVTVYEASTRIGGRTFTGRQLFPQNQELICELGGEFIDSGHATLRALARELEIKLDNRLEASEGMQAEVFWINRKEVPTETLILQFQQVAARFEAAVNAAESDTTAFDELDNTTLATWLETNVPSRTFPELHSVLTAAYRGEYGLETNEQSALNLLNVIGHEDTTTFRIFGDSDNAFHAHGGNDTFAKRLANLLGDRVKLDALLTRVTPAGPSFRMTLETRLGFESEVDADRIVFALPFSVLRQVDLDAVELSTEKRKAIAELGYGTHTKSIGAFATRVWRDSHRSGSVTSDLPLQQVWDGSIGQVEVQVATSNAQGALTNLLGGRAGARADELLPDVAFRAVLGELEAIFPGIEAAYISASARRMHWPSAPLFRGSTTCYRPGQWLLSGSEGKREGNLHFCGEHCSLDFQGSMEGAAETGTLIAAEILNDLEIAMPVKLASIVALKTLVPQPCYGATTTLALRLGRRARAAAVANAHTLAVAHLLDASSRRGA